MKGKSSKRFLVTSALPYANGPIHLGHLAGAYLNADLYVRYLRLNKKDVKYICGSDEHGVPITLAAEKKGVTPQDIVDEFHRKNKRSFERFGISFDYYGRTSSPVHHRTSQDFFLRLNQSGIFKIKSEKQLFDEKTGMFLPDRYVIGTCPVCAYPDAYGDQCEKCGSTLSPAELINPRSALSGEKPVYRETRHWFLPLGDFQSKVSAWIKGKRNWKSNVLGQVKSWLNEGLSDRAVTRDLNWGVPVPLPEGRDKVLYVWFDAPIGYISATREWAEAQGDPDLWKKYWQDPDTKLVHFIGKDNIVFHCIMFPVMLMAHGDYILPEDVPANEFLNLQGRKLSTSKNYAVWLDDYLSKFPADPLRYYLAVNAPETKDSDFTWTDFQQRNNSELADILGNFINRTLAFADRNFDHKVPSCGELGDLDRAMIEEIASTPERLAFFYERYQFRKAVAALMDLARSCNKYFNDSEPWRILKKDRTACATTLHICLSACRTLAVLMAPIMPFSAERILAMLGLNRELDNLNWSGAGELAMPAGQQLGEITILFDKIENKQIEPEIIRLKKIADQLGEEPVEQRISIEEFAKTELKVARVVSAESIAKADKLLKLIVEIEGKERQIVAGIAKHYSPEQLINRKIVVVTNLKPAQIRGIESDGMLLAAESETGELSLLAPDRDMPSGSRIR